MLALALGSTVAELQERMSYDEYLHWSAFYRQEPFGEWRADLRTADVLALLANVNRNPKKQKAFGSQDFMRKWWQAEPKPDAKPDGAALLEKFRMLTAQPGRGLDG